MKKHFLIIMLGTLLFPIKAKRERQNTKPEKPTIKQSGVCCNHEHVNNVNKMAKVLKGNKSGLHKSMVVTDALLSKNEPTLTKMIHSIEDEKIRKDAQSALPGALRFEASDFLIIQKILPRYMKYDLQKKSSKPIAQSEMHHVRPLLPSCD